MVLVAGKGTGIPCRWGLKAELLGSGITEEIALTELQEPKFCPNCASPLLPRECQSFIREEEGLSYEGGWGCHCVKCGWSGDISPDVEEEK